MSNNFGYFSSASANLSFQPLRINEVLEPAFARIECSWRRDAENRLVAISKLKRGWDGHFGRPIEPDTISFAASVLGAVMHPRVPKPDIIPLSNGGIQIEWHRNGYDVEIEVSGPNKISAYVYDINEDNSTEYAFRNDLNKISGMLERIKN